MKLSSLIHFLLYIIFLSCHSIEKNSQVTDTDVATSFIRNTLDNKPEAAEHYLFNDEANRQYFEIFWKQYHKKSKAELEKYKNAIILINEISNVTDSISIINYSNSYNRAIKNKLKLIRINGKWLVDLKYTFSGNL